MIGILAFLNGWIAGLFGVLFWPFKSVDPIWALLVVSFLTAVLMLWVFDRVSDQGAIRRIKTRIRGNLLAVRLYQHDVGVVLRLQGRILKDSGRYMSCSIKPMLVLLIPLVLIMVHLNLYFSYRPLEPGQPVVVQARLNMSLLSEEIDLKTGPAVKVETPPVRMIEKGEVAWRIRAGEPGPHKVMLYIGQEKVEKELEVGESWSAVSPLRTALLLDWFLHPGEPPLVGSGKVESIEVRYPARRLSLVGWNLHWVFLFFLFSLLFAFALKGFLGVEF